MANGKPDLLRVTGLTKSYRAAGEEVAVLRREIKALRRQASAGAGPGAEEPGEASDERPPHY